MDQENYIIQIHKLDFYFGDFRALTEVSLEVPKGSVFGFLGPNGAGKTTTIRLLLDLFHAPKGQINLFGLSQKTKNIMLPLGVGIAGIISYLIVVRGWEYAAFHPYGFPDMVGGFAAVARTMLLENMQPIYLSLGLCAILTGIAAMDLHHKRIY